MKKYNFMHDPESENSDSVTLERKKRKKWDIGPRIVCLLVALVIWIYMVNINDNEVEESKMLTIEIVGEEVMQTNSEMAIYGIDKKVVNVTVKGSNRDLRKYGAGDYKVTVDVSGLDTPGDHTLQINVIPPEKSDITVVSFEPSTVTVHIDNRIEKEVPLIVDYTSRTNRFDILEYSTAQSASTIKIKGPKNVLEKIDVAVFEITGTLDSSRQYTDFDLCFYDKKNKEIFEAEYEYIDYSTQDITVDLHAIFRMSVPIKVKVLNEGSELVPVLDKEYVSVYGDGAIMQKLDNISYIITLDYAVEGSVVDCILDNADIDGDGIGDNLPAGVYVSGDQHVKINFEKPQSQEITE